MSTKKPNWLTYIWWVILAVASVAWDLFTSYLKRRGAQAEATKAEEGEVEAELDSQLTKDQTKSELEHSLEQIKDSNGTREIHSLFEMAQPNQFCFSVFST